MHVCCIFFFVVRGGVSTKILEYYCVHDFLMLGWFDVNWEFLLAEQR